MQVVSAMLERLDVPAISDLYSAIISLNSPRVLYALNSASEKLVLFIMVCGVFVVCLSCSGCSGCWRSFWGFVFLWFRQHWN